MKLTEYCVGCGKISKPIKIALVADTHERLCDKAIELLKKAKPDYIAASGDIASSLFQNDGERKLFEEKKIVNHENAFRFLTECRKIAKTFLSLGNHELCGHYNVKTKGKKITPENLEKIRKTGVVLLDNGFVSDGIITVGGLTSGYTYEDNKPKLEWLDVFSKEKGVKILLSHNPEYYAKYLEKYDFDLVLSGHAHGGQIRLFGRGLFAPGQGVFPKYTSGVHDKLVISQGLANTAGIIPRLFNPTEVVIVNLIPE